MRSKYLILNFVRIIIILFLFSFIAYAQDAEELFQEGTSLIKNGQYDIAINKLVMCTKINPGHVGCFCNLAVAYAYERNLDKAIEQIEKVIYKEPAPSRGILFFNLGSIYDMANNIQEAENNYKYSFYLLPYFSQVYANLGMLYYVNKDTEKGMEYVYKANSMDSFMPDMQPEVKKVGTTGYLTAFTADKSAPPFLYLYHSPAWHLTLAINYMNLKDFDKARSEVQKAKMALDKNSPLQSDQYALVEVYIYEGNTYLLQENLDKALQEFQTAYNINPKHIGAVCNIGTVYYLKGDYDTAAQYCKIAMDINPEFPGTITLKEALIEKGKL